MNVTRAKAGWGMLIGILLAMIPVAGVILSMMRSFDALGSSGAGDASALSDSIKSTLIFASLGGLVGILGACLFITSLVFFIIKTVEKGKTTEQSPL